KIKINVKDTSNNNIVIYCDQIKSITANLTMGTTINSGQITASGNTSVVLHIETNDAKYKIPRTSANDTEILDYILSKNALF
ncbi:MAG: hypothetical protein JXR36_07435, partial [Bacteroidales bacterium]|nr:hypothetical protein [Bacteroidales bacterium]